MILSRNSRLVSFPVRFQEILQYHKYKISQHQRLYQCFPIKGSRLILINIAYRKFLESSHKRIFAHFTFRTYLANINFMNLSLEKIQTIFKRRLKRRLPMHVIIFLSRYFNDDNINICEFKVLELYVVTDVSDHGNTCKCTIVMHRFRSRFTRLVPTLQQKL